MYQSIYIPEGAEVGGAYQNKRQKLTNANKKTGGKMIEEQKQKAEQFERYRIICNCIEVLQEYINKNEKPRNRRKIKGLRLLRREIKELKRQKDCIYKNKKPTQ